MVQCTCEGTNGRPCAHKMTLEQVGVHWEQVPHAPLLHIYHDSSPLGSDNSIHHPPLQQPAVAASGFSHVGGYAAATVCLASLSVTLPTMSASYGVLIHFGLFSFPFCGMLCPGSSRGCSCKLFQEEHQPGLSPFPPCSCLYAHPSC